MSVPSSAYFAPVPLKSKRLATSRLAWSTELVTSCKSNSDTTSNDGMPYSSVRLAGQVTLVPACQFQKPGHRARILIDRIAMIVLGDYFRPGNVGHRCLQLGQRT